MKRKCFECGRKIIIGHDLYYQLNIVLIDPFLHNIYHGDTTHKYATFCEKHGEEAKDLFSKMNLPDPKYGETDTSRHEGDNPSLRAGEGETPENQEDL